MAVPLRLAELLAASVQPAGAARGTQAVLRRHAAMGPAGKLSSLRLGMEARRQAGQGGQGGRHGGKYALAGRRAASREAVRGPARI